MPTSRATRVDDRAVIAREQQHLQAQAFEPFDGLAAVRRDRRRPRRSAPSSACRRATNSGDWPSCRRAATSACLGWSNRRRGRRAAVRCRPAVRRRARWREMPWPGHDFQTVDRRQREPALARPRATIGSASGCLLNCSTAAAVASSSSSETPVGRHDRARRCGLPSVTVPVLSSTTVVTRPAISSAWASLIRMPNSAPRPLATRIAVGVASPNAQGHATTSTATVADKPSHQSPADKPQASSVASGDHQHDRHEPRHDAVGQPLNFGFRFLRPPHQLDHLRQRRLARRPRARARRASPGR